MSVNIKTIILNHLNSEQKATIKFSNTSTTNITLKLPFAPQAEYILLVRTSQNFYKKTIQNSVYSQYSLSNKIDLESKISVLIIEKIDAEKRPVFWGGTDCTNSQDCQNQVEQCQEDNSSDIILESSKEKTNEEKLEDNAVISSPNIISKPNYFGESNLDNESSMKDDLFDYSIQELQEQIDYHLSRPEIIDNSPCASCKYKQEFYQCQKMQEAKEILKEISNSQDGFEKSPPKYYSLIEGQYNEMFSNYPEFLVLSQILPNSKWIKVEANDEVYVLGIIYQDDMAKYLCYGIPQSIKGSAPPELADISQWVPYDVDNPNGAGVWIMYQSAETGETVKVEVV